MSDSAARAAAALRDASNFDWAIIPILVMVIYIYNVEIGKKNWDIVFAGLALWGMDWFNEIANALIFHFNGFAPLWAAPGKSSYLILIGLNIEICLMFLVMGIATAHVLPEDKKAKILGLPNRLFFSLLFAGMAVVVELFLNSIGALTWEFSWWSAKMPLLIFIFGYLTFFIVSYWVYDMPTLKQKARAVGAIYAFDIGCLALFGAVLGWI